MLKKTITYEDYNGEERTEDLYFNLDKYELSKMEMLTPGGIGGFLDRMAKSKDYKGIMEFIEDLVKMSYGRKSDDGRKFEKSDEITKDFMATNAYSELMMELITGREVAIAAFVEGILPQKLVEQVKLEQAAKEVSEEKKKIAEANGTAERVMG